MKITTYMLLNFQSWSETSGPVNLSKDRLNVLIAPSETGKSVLIKVLKEMCFSSKWGYTPEGLIRHGEEIATAVFELENGNIVIFELTKKTRNYKLAKYVKGSKEPIMQNWAFNNSREVDIPVEIEDEMGLLLDRKARTLINIIDKDMPMPFVTSDEELSARILTAVTEDAEVERRLEFLKEWENRFRVSYSNVQRDTNNACYSYENAPSVNITQLRILVDRCNKLYNVLEYLEDYALKDNSKLIESKPEEIKIISLDTELSLMDEIVSLNDIVDYIENISKSRPEEVEPINPAIVNVLGLRNKVGNILKVIIDMPMSVDNKVEEPSVFDRELNAMGCIENVITVLNDLEVLHSSKVEEKSTVDIKDIPNVLRLLANITDLNKIYNLVSNLPVIEDKKEPSNPTVLIDTLNCMKDLSVLTEYIDLREEYEGILERCDKAEVDYKEVESQLPICPTCGQFIKEKMHDC